MRPTAASRCMLLVVVALAAVAWVPKAEAKCPISTDIVFEDFKWNLISDDKIAKFASKSVGKAIGRLATDYYSRCEWQYLLGLEPDSGTWNTLVYADVLNDTLWKVYDTISKVNVDLTQYTKFEGADVTVEGKEFNPASIAASQVGGLLTLSISCVTKFVGGLCGVETPNLGDHANTVHKVISVFKRLGGIIKRTPPVPPPIKTAGAKLEDLADSKPVKELSDKAKDVDKNSKRACDEGFPKTVRDQIGNQDSGFNCFRAVLSRFMRVVSWSKVVVFSVEDMYRALINSQLATFEATAKITRPTKHSWGAMTPAQQRANLCRCDLFPGLASKVPSGKCVSSSRRRLAGAELLYNISSSSFGDDSPFGELSTHHKRALLAVTDILDDSMAGFVRDFIQTADSFGDSVKGIVDGIRAFESKLLNLPLEDMVKAIRFMDVARGVLGKLTEPFNMFKSVLEAIDKVASKLECPSLLGPICNLADLASSLIDGAINVILKAITGKPLNDWIDEALAKLGLDKIVAKIPGLAQLEDALQKVEDVGNELIGGITAHFTKVKTDLAAMLDMRKFDPEYLKFKDGVSVATGVKRKVDYAFNSKPITFSCDAGSIPIVETATRTVYNCPQYLAPYVRYPCPQGVSSCTVGYEAQWPPKDCLDPLLNPVASSTDFLAGVRRSMGSTGPLPIEDYLRVSYYCLGPNGKLPVLAELMTAEGDLGIRNNNVGTWDGTQQYKHAATQGMKLAGTGSPSTSIDCSGGGRRFWLEYLQAPSYGGKVLPANTWPPCMSSWFSTNTLPRKDLVSEFCWWWGWQMQPKLPDTAQGSDTTWLAEEGSAADKTRWAYMQANLPFECMGSAHGAYTTLVWTVDTSATLCLETSKNKWARLKNWKECKRITNSMLNPDGRDKSCNPTRACYGPADSEFYSRADCAPNWTPLQVCQNGYTLSSGSDTLKGSDFENTGTVWYFKDDAYLSALRNEKSARQLVLIQHAEALNNGAATYQQCMSTYQGCNGQGKCNFGTCIAEKLQFSCVAPEDYDALTAAPGAITGGLVLIFGSDKPGSKSQTVTCPNQGLATIKLAQYGGGLTWTDVTDDIAKGCSDSTCHMDIEKLPDWKGQTLRVEFECSCGAGMRGDRDKVTQMCVPCEVGSYRKKGMPDCEVCLEGRFQDTPGQSECKRCPAGSTSAPGAITCTLCPAGTYVEDPASPKCALAPINTFAPEEGTTRPTPCEDNYFSGPGSALPCLPCPAGQSRVGAALECTVCPAGQVSSQGGYCRDCPVGTIASSQNTAECMMCPVGSYSSTPGSSECTACPNAPEGVRLLTPDVGATSASNCTMREVYIDWDFVEEELAAGRPGRPNWLLDGTSSQSTTTTGGTGRRLQSLEVEELELGPLGAVPDGGEAEGATMEPSDEYAFKEPAEEEGYAAEGPEDVAQGSASRRFARQLLQQAEGLPVGGAVVVKAADNPQTSPTGAAVSPAVVVAPKAAKATGAAGVVAAAAASPLCLRLLNFASGGRGAELVGELGNSACNGGPFNTEACGYDGGDCCISTCQPVVIDGERQAYSCRDNTMNCKDPAAIAAEAAIAASAGGDACLPSGISPTSTVPDTYPDTCPEPADSRRLGNGICDDELNTPACGWDKGDCCSTTCKRSVTSFGSCMQFDCRDPEASTDTQPPQLYGVPDGYFEARESRIEITQGKGQAVTATDNYPCFDPTVTVTTERFATNPRTHSCSKKILYYLNRSWSAKDRAGNEGSRTAMIGVVDDQQPVVTITKLAFSKHPKNVGVVRTVTLSIRPLPNKKYRWRVAEGWQESKRRMARVSYKSGSSATFTFALAHPKAPVADFLVPRGWHPKRQPVPYTITLETSYTNCEASTPSRWYQRAGSIRVFVVDR